MKKLLNTLYIMSEDCYLSLKNENVVVNTNDMKRMVPLIGIESIITFSYKGVSPQLAGECHERGIGLSCLTPNGRFLCMPSGRSRGNVLLRKEQYRIADDDKRSLLIAQNMIIGKMYNSNTLLKRYKREYSLRIDTQKIDRANALISSYIEASRKVSDIDTLRGLEGKVADTYFSVFDLLVLNQGEDFSFDGRSKRPPLDRINAMLSFGYTLLAHDCASALEAVGLDSYVGFMHTDRPGRMSLALDIMEEMRSMMVDRFVLSLINQKMIKAEDFRIESSGAVFLNDDGRKKFLTYWQERKKEQLFHPFLKEKICWGLVPHIQALLLARLIRGDYDAYPVFMWR